MKAIRYLGRWWPQLGLAVWSVLTLLPVAPSFHPVPTTDSSVFIYIGSRILKGSIPYRDVWDHKGPLIYYINALGLGLSGNSRWGIWLLEVISVVAAVWLVYAIVSKYWGKTPALLSGFVFLFSLQSVLHDGNLTEEYAMPLQLACLALLLVGLKRPQRLTFFALGFAAGLSFLLRPNIIIIPLAIGIFLLYEMFANERLPLAPMLLFCIIGGLTILFAASAYFWFHDALGQMWDAMLRYNLVYSTMRSGSRLSVMGYGVSLLALATLLSAGGWLLALRTLLRQQPTAAPRGLLLTLLIALPLEMLMAALPSRDYRHYFMSWLPVMSVLAGLSISWLFARTPPRVAVLLAAVGCLLPLAILHAADDELVALWQRRGVPVVDFSTTPYHTTLEYINLHAQPDAHVLFWGNNLSLQWISGREAPASLAYQSPLALPGYVTPERVAAFVDELRTHPPVLILDTTINNDPLPNLETPLDIVPEVLAPIYEFVAANYAATTQLYQTDWVVYTHLP